MKKVKFLLIFSVILLTVSMTATFVAAKQREHGGTRLHLVEDEKKTEKKIDDDKKQAQLHFFASSTEILPPLGVTASSTTSTGTTTTSTSTPVTSTTTPPVSTTTPPTGTSTPPVTATTTTATTTTATTTPVVPTKPATTTPIISSINNKVNDILADGFFGSNYYTSSAFSSGATRSLAFIGVAAAILGVVLVWGGSLPKKVIR